MNKKKYWIGGIVILIAIASLGFFAFRGAATYYYTVTEIVNQGNELRDDTIRVTGQVVTDSVQQSQNRNVKFVILDRTNTQNTLSISYTGSLPDAFKEGNDVIVEGKLTPPGTFEAKQIIVKCPSKYEPANKTPD